VDARRWSPSLEPYRRHALVAGATERGAPTEAVVYEGELAAVAEAALREARRLARTEPAAAFARTPEDTARALWRAVAVMPDDRAAREWFAGSLLEVLTLARARFGPAGVEVALRVTAAPTEKDGY
jgi:hypothetical protein